MSPNDLAIVIPVVAAAISFLAAVVAVVIGQTLGQRFQRSADERRWGREDALRRRTRSEDMAREAITRLSAATELVAWTAGYARGEEKVGKRQYVAANLSDVSALCQPVRRAALEINDDRVRRHLEKACDLLPNSNTIRHYGAASAPRVGWAVGHTSELVVSAYLRDVALPDPLSESQARAFKVFNEAYSAMEDLWSEFEDEDEDEDG